MKFGVNSSNFLLNSSTFLIKINNLLKLITEAGLYDKQDASRFPVFHHSCLLRCTNLYLLCFQVYKFVTPVFISKRIVTFICRLTNLDYFIYKVHK